MTIEDVAERADAWSEAIKKIIKAATSINIALQAVLHYLLSKYYY